MDDRERWCEREREREGVRELYADSVTWRYIYTTSQKYLNPSKFLFPILKVLYSMKQVKHHNGFIYYTEYKSSWATLNSN